MRKLRLIGVAGLAIAAFAIPTSTSATAEDFVYSCPDHYQPAPTIAVPPGSRDRDNNNNFVVCVKGPQGSNQHFNVKDDKGEVVSPTEWDTDPVAYSAWLVSMSLDQWGTYTLDPTPVDVVDDIAP
jgi:hypothetical protein